MKKRKEIHTNTTTSKRRWGRLRMKKRKEYTPLKEDAGWCRLKWIRVYCRTRSAHLVGLKHLIFFENQLENDHAHSNFNMWRRWLKIGSLLFGLVPFSPFSFLSLGEWSNSERRKMAPQVGFKPTTSQLALTALHGVY